MALWKHPGTDVTGMLGRCEKVVSTCEEVTIKLILTTISGASMEA